MEWKNKITDFLLQNGPKLLGAIIILVAGFVVASWIGKLVERWLEHKQLEPPLRMLMGRIIRLGVVAMAVVMALGTAGFNITALIAGLSIAGVGVGLALQGVLGNLVAGLVIIFTKPFRVGEYVDLLGEEGVVDRIELFTTTLRHPDLSRVVIPNRKIVGEVLHNYGTIRQLDLNVGVAYDSDLEKTLSAVREVLSHNPDVLKDPAPHVGVSTLADSSINISVRPWVEVGDYRQTRVDLYKAIVERFRASNIAIPFPQREVRMLGN
ncbi:MAG TPA: mechanosensitive ion channel family protein [Verrucomicrobiae bacterium]|nr:mechanosensitive ion channel family protein [Verrucomicrobiae bacterium]